MEEEEGTVIIYNRDALSSTKKNHFNLKGILAQAITSGAIFEVTDLYQARIAAEAGAKCLLVSGYLRMPDPSLVKKIKNSFSVPVMARVRVGHFVEAQIMENSGADFIDESEMLTPADEDNYINKHKFTIPFACGCRSLGEALRRIGEGATIIRYQGGCLSETVKAVRSVRKEVGVVKNMEEDEVFSFARRIDAPCDQVAQTLQMGALTALQLAAGGIATPADAAMMMQLGCDGVVVENTIFQGGDASVKARAIVRAIRHYRDTNALAAHYGQD